ncbi:MAG: response regulator, partial [Planctomycetes bacterium]|nr:response regulator [Planctomycetota bacterium]
PEVAILDNGLPGSDGHELARQLRERLGPNGMVLIALTGWGQEEDRRRSRAAGFDYHLVKPVEPEALHALLARLEPASRAAP